MLQRRRRYDNFKVNKVGAFGEDLVEAIIDCNRAPYEDGDYCLSDLNLGIEVKVTDSLHEWRIPLDQLALYNNLANFPYNGYLFILIVYRNWYVPNGKPRGSTALSAYCETLDIRSFIADNLQRVYVLDIEFVNLLKAKGICRISDRSIPLHPGVLSLNIRPALLKRMFDEKRWKEVVEDTSQWRATAVGLDFEFNPYLF